MHPLLSIAEDLERRDALVAAKLARVERLVEHVDELRIDTRVTAAGLRNLPAGLAWVEGALADAERGAARAAAALRSAAGDELGLRRARRDLDGAEANIERLREAKVGLAEALVGTEQNVEVLGRRVAALHEQLRDVAPPVDTLEGIVAWASQARGSLIVEASVLERERESIVREASELLGSVLGDPLAATSVAGLRDRLQRALP